MLPDRLSRLLTACIDGELDGQQRKAVLQLLRRSKQARRLLRALQQDAERLRGVPCPTLGPEFAEQVLQVIGSRAAEPSRPSTHPVRRYLPTWGVAAGAAVLLAVGLTTYVYFAGGAPNRFA